MILSTWLRNFLQKYILVCKLHTAFLPNLLHPNVSFIAVLKVDIFNKKLYTRKHF